MSNADRVNGARPIRHLDGSPYNGAVTRYVLLAAQAGNVFVGDFVKTSGTADADGVPAIAAAAATNPIRGVVVGFEPEKGVALELSYRIASTLRYALVADAPDLIFEIQEDNSATLAITDVGQNFDIVVAAGNTSTGSSGMEMDTSSASGTDGQLRLMGLVQRPDNELAANAKVEVMINEHEFKQIAGT